MKMLNTPKPLKMSEYKGNLGGKTKMSAKTTTKVKAPKSGARSGGCACGH